MVLRTAVSVLSVFGLVAAHRPVLRDNPGDRAEAAWARKTVHAAHQLALDSQWRLQGAGDLTRSDQALHVGVKLRDHGLKGLPVATARRNFGGEDWRPYNRLSFYLKTETTGIPVLTLMVAIVNGGTPPLSEVHARENVHNVTVPGGVWTRVDWEIPHVSRDRVNALEFRPWVNKALPDPWDRAAYAIRDLRLELVDADAFEGWNVPPGKIALSHSGYEPNSNKTALATNSQSSAFTVVDRRTKAVVLTRPVRREKTRLGDFQVLDFSELRTAGEYMLRLGASESVPFRVAANVFDRTIEKTLNFFYGQRCGVAVPGIHEECHRDWQATLGDRKIIMNGGWHDAADLTQGLVNTGEVVWSMYRLAERLRATGRTPQLLASLEEEALHGLHWLHRVRFDGGHRIGFAGLNIWTNGIIGDSDDRTRAALNNPNVNYIAAAAGAMAYLYLRDRDGELAERSLVIAEDDWRHAIAGVESPETWSTPAFAATPLELASIGAIASAHLFAATGKPEYSVKARELAEVIVNSQQRSPVGKQFPLAGFFYTGPNRATLFHQFHRGNDQAPLEALALLCRTYPRDKNWARWYAALALYSEYQRRSATATSPYNVLPAYVYRESDGETYPENDRYGSSRNNYRRQVLGGMPMGDGHYLKAFPVWFTRRGNYGVLLSQTQALAAAADLRGNSELRSLATRQLEWVLGRNPFAQSTMWGEGHGYHPQYSVSVGDLVGALPVGMMTRNDGDVPYWPTSNTYVFKEVWVHSSARWLATLAHLDTSQQKPAPVSFVKGRAGELTINSRSAVELIGDNLDVKRAGEGVWKVRAVDPTLPFVAALRDGTGNVVVDYVGWP